MKFAKALIASVLLSVILSSCTLPPGSASEADKMIATSTVWTTEVEDVDINLVFGPNVQAPDLLVLHYIINDTGIKEVYKFNIKYGFLYVEPLNTLKTTVRSDGKYTMPAAEELNIFKATVYKVTIEDDAAILCHEQTGETLVLHRDEAA